MDDDKYMFDDIALEKECYHLMSLFLSSANINKLKNKYPDSQFHVFPIYEPQEIKKLLVSISIQLRMVDDLMRDHNRSGYVSNDPVGSIYYQKNHSTRDASVRDAFNKVIHTKSLSIIT